jgi:hypothetical protein
VPPDAVAVHETGLPTVPVVGQASPRVRGDETVSENVVVCVGPPVEVPVIVIGNVPAGVLALVVILI